MRHPSGHGLCHSYDGGENIKGPDHEHGFGPKMARMHERALGSASESRLGKHMARLSSMTHTTVKENGSTAHVVAGRKATREASRAAVDQARKRGFTGHFDVATTQRGSTIKGAYRKESNRLAKSGSSGWAAWKAKHGR